MPLGQAKLRSSNRASQLAHAESIPAAPPLFLSHFPHLLPSRRPPALRPPRAAPLSASRRQAPSQPPPRAAKLRPGSSSRRQAPTRRLLAPPSRGAAWARPPHCVRSDLHRPRLDLSRPCPDLQRRSVPAPIRTAPALHLLLTHERRARPPQCKAEGCRPWESTPQRDGRLRQAVVEAPSPAAAPELSPTTKGPDFFLFCKAGTWLLLFFKAGTRLLFILYTRTQLCYMFAFKGLYVNFRPSQHLSPHRTCWSINALSSLFHQINLLVALARACSFTQPTKQQMHWEPPNQYNLPNIGENLSSI
jgi:hypothetical protein